MAREVLPLGQENSGCVPGCLARCRGSGISARRLRLNPSLVKFSEPTAHDRFVP
jgi:hypothetical protein